MTLNYAGIPPTSYGPSTTAPTNAGTYRARATFAGDANHFGSQDAKDFTIGTVTLTVSANPFTRQYGDPNPSPFTFQYSGFIAGEGPANLTTAPICTTGVAQTANVGTYPNAITCSGGAATNYKFAYNSANLTIAAEDATFTYTGGSLFATASPTASVTVSALVTPAADPSIDKLSMAKVKFVLYNSNGAWVGTYAASVSLGGVATYTLSLGPDSYTVTVLPDTGSYYLASPETGVVTVYQPGQSVTGGGWINDPYPGVSLANKHGNFGFNVRYDKNGNLKGQAVFVYRGADGYTYMFKSNAWQGGFFALPDTQHASFSGKCNMQLMDAAGNFITSVGNLTCRVDMTDLGEPGSSDRYAFTATNGSGGIVHQAGNVGSQVLLGGGNIKIDDGTKK